MLRDLDVPEWHEGLWVHDALSCTKRCAARSEVSSVIALTAG